MVRAFIVLAALAGPVHAQDARPAPAYFVETVMQTSTANALAVSCPRLSIDLGAASRASGAALTRLAEDGFAPENLLQTMQDPTDAIAALQTAFTAKHGLGAGASQDDVCAAGLAEIAEGSDIGALLLEVQG